MKPLSAGAPARGGEAPAVPASSDIPNAAINGMASELVFTSVSLDPDGQAIGEGMPICPPGRNRSDAECCGAEYYAEQREDACLEDEQQKNVSRRRADRAQNRHLSPPLVQAGQDGGQH